jgi:hypothetical protein
LKLKWPRCKAWIIAAFSLATSVAFMLSPILYKYL